jgi:hypothetical protein
VIISRPPHVLCAPATLEVLDWRRQLMRILVYRILCFPQEPLSQLPRIARSSSSRPLLMVPTTCLCLCVLLDASRRRSCNYNLSSLCQLVKFAAGLGYVAYPNPKSIGTSQANPIQSGIRLLHCGITLESMITRIYATSDRNPPPSRIGHINQPLVTDCLGDI